MFGYLGCFFFAAHLILWSMIAAAFVPQPVAAQTANAPDVLTYEAVPVIVWNRELFKVRAGFESFSPAQRAALITERILAIPSGQSGYKVEAKDATLGEHSGAWFLVNSRTVFGLLTQDADIEAGETFEALKRKTVTNLQEWLAVRDEQEKWPLIFKGVVLSLTASLAFWLAVFASIRYSS